MAGYAGRSFVNRTTNSVAKCDASAALPPFPQTSNLFPARKHCSIRSAAFATCESSSRSDCSVSFAAATASFKISDELCINHLPAGIVKDILRRELNGNINCGDGPRSETPLPKSLPGGVVENLMPRPFQHPSRWDIPGPRIHFDLR